LAPSTNSKTGKDEDEDSGDLTPTGAGNQEIQEQLQELTVKVKVKEQPPTPTPILMVTQGQVKVAPPPSVAMERDYREYDLPTESDDSSMGQSSPIDSEFDWNCIYLFFCFSPLFMKVSSLSVIACNKNVFLFSE
jgi:hypothetical protein